MEKQILSLNQKKEDLVVDLKAAILNLHQHLQHNLYGYLSMAWFRSRHKLELKVEIDDSELSWNCSRENGGVNWEENMSEDEKERCRSQMPRPTSHPVCPRSSH